MEGNDECRVHVCGLSQGAPPTAVGMARPATTLVIPNAPSKFSSFRLAPADLISSPAKLQMTHVVPAVSRKALSWFAAVSLLFAAPAAHLISD